VGQAAPVGQERLPRVAIGHVLADRVLHVLAGRMEPPGLLVQPAGRPEVGGAELAARVADALPQDVQGAPPLDLGGQPLEEPRPHRGAVVGLEPLPLPRLGGQHEVGHVAREQAQRAVVGVGRPLAIAAGNHVAVGGEGLSERGAVPAAVVGPAPQEPRSIASSKLRSEITTSATGVQDAIDLASEVGNLRREVFTRLEGHPPPRRGCGARCMGSAPRS
jgi:hypothetical protein